MQLSKRNFPLATFCSMQMGKKKFLKDVVLFQLQSKRARQVEVSVKMESFKSLVWKLEGEEGPDALLRCL